MNEALTAEIRQQLQAAKHILVVSHIRPDGDAIGSLLGFGLSLQAAGKDVKMVSSDGVPSSFRHLAGSEQVLTEAKGNFDFIAVVDCSDLERTGTSLNGSLGADKSEPDLNIDHHVTNLNFARFNLVEPGAVATAEILVKYLPVFGLPMPADVVNALMTGLITDTIGFRTSNMNPEALRTAAKLMEAGADLPELYQKALLQHSFEATRYWGAGLSRLQRQGKIVWTSLTREDRHKVDYPGRDDADLINVLSSIEGAAVAVIFIEQNNSHVKVSWRAQPGLDVSKIALEFGGGGHKAASGADIEGSLEDVQQKVLSATQALFNGNRSEGIGNHTRL